MNDAIVNSSTNDATVNTSVQILGKTYMIRCLESEVDSLMEAADYLNKKMGAVQAVGTVINLERIAMITALNITRALFQSEHDKQNLIKQINHRIGQLHEKMDSALTKIQ